MNPFDFLVETYATERLKTLSVWSAFADGDMEFRPAPRIRTPHEQMVHQCISEDNWFQNFFGIDVGAPPLPATPSRRGFIIRYWEDSALRQAALESRDESFWEQEVMFFDVPRSCAWIMVRRIAHTAHHRGQQMALLRMLNHDLFSNYGPTADTNDKVAYAYPDIETLLRALGT